MDYQKMFGKVTCIVGTQWGDEGKGKLVDIMSEKYDVVARFAGGSNAGHTIVCGGKKHAFHLMPSGILHKNTLCLLGNGTVIHLPTLAKELEKLDEAKIDYTERVFISDRAHLVFDFHHELDAKREIDLGEKKIGTTKKGIGPAYEMKMNRLGVRAGELKDFTLFEKRFAQCAQWVEQFGIVVDTDAELKKYKDFAKIFCPMIIDSFAFVQKSLLDGKSVLAEGANATHLDIDFGTYPYVTSSNTIVGGVSTGLGIPFNKINSSIGIVKAYTTRVGEGPFPSELKNDLGDTIRENGHEYGTTTGRPRRCGWFDAMVVKFSVLLNGLTAVNITKLDVLTGIEELRVATGYKLNGNVIEYFPSNIADLERVEVVYETLSGWKEDIAEVKKFTDLPENAQKYVERIEELIECKVRFIGVGADRESMIYRE